MIDQFKKRKTKLKERIYWILEQHINFLVKFKYSAIRKPTLVVYKKAQCKQFIKERNKFLWIFCSNSIVFRIFCFVLWRLQKWLLVELYYTFMKFRIFLNEIRTASLKHKYFFTDFNNVERPQFSTTHSGPETYTIVIIVITNAENFNLYLLFRYRLKNSK